MATRRKYKARHGDHGRMVDDGAVVTAQASPAAPPPTSQPDAPNPLQRALEASRHADDLQHQHAMRRQVGLPERPIDPAEQHAIDTYVDAIPNLTDHQRRFLKSHPSLMSEPYVSLMRHAILMARHAGIADDTPQMDAAILAGIAKDIQHHHALSQLTSAHARPTPENHAMHQDANQAAAALQAEAERHMAAMAAENPPPPPPAPRRSIPMSAPVSRDVPMSSGERRPGGQIHLSRDEVMIAHVSFPHLSKAQAEREYAKNRQRMHEWKRDGRIQGDR
jgi:hypothetical protein